MDLADRRRRQSTVCGMATLRHTSVCSEKKSMSPACGLCSPNRNRICRMASSFSTTKPRWRPRATLSTSVLRSKDRPSQPAVGTPAIFNTIPVASPAPARKSSMRPLRSSDRKEIRSDVSWPDFGLLPRCRYYSGFPTCCTQTPRSHGPRYALPTSLNPQRYLTRSHGPHGSAR